MTAVYGRSALRFFKRILPVLGVGLLLACGPTGSATAPREDGAAAAPVKRGAKLLVMGRYNTNEPKTGIVPFGLGGSTGQADFPYIFHAGLTTTDPGGTLRPWIASKVPTITDGDWSVFPDGHMEVTWKLRPGIKWHDGTPLTAGDFVFRIQDRTDPKLANPPLGIELLSAVTAPDPETLVASWKAPYPYANVSQPGLIPALPVHILSDLYNQGDAGAFLNSRYWTDEFVGVGPFKMGEWVIGSRIDAVAFDDYFLGRPKLDHIDIEFYGDTTVVYTNLLADQIDVVSIGTFEAGQFLQVKNGWAELGKGTALAVFSGTRNLKFQFKYPEDPWVDRRVRQALIHMLDRPALSKGLLGGLGGPADTAVSPTNPVYPLVMQRGIAHYGFDMAQAQRLMDEAGWQRGVDGMYRRTSAGTPFSVDLREKDIEGNIREAAAIADQWKTAGLVVNNLTHRNGGPDDAMLSSTTHGVMALPLREVHTAFAAFTTPAISTEANRWRGANVGGYSNPEYDHLYDQSIATLNVTERQGLIADFLKIEAADAASIHLFYDMAQQSIIFRKGVTGPGVTSIDQLAPAWNIHEWDLSI